MSATFATAPASATLVVESDETRSGQGLVTDDVINHGRIVGLGVELELRLIFGATTIVTGDGSFENTVIGGTMAPGNSPGVVTTTDQGYLGTTVIEFELGGTSPGFGSGKYDQINDTGTVYLYEPPTVKVLTFEDYVPTPGDSFDVMTWQTGIEGSFGSLVIDQFFLDHDITFIMCVVNPTGAGSLRLTAVNATAVPETSAALFGGLAAIMVSAKSLLRR